MKILITGATGLVGSSIVKLCHQQGVSVNYLTTSKDKIETKDNYKGFYWSPKKNEINTDCFKGVEAVIHLAGATISKKWTASYKQVILNSRMQTTQLLYNTIKRGNYNVQKIISASAIGIYPDSLTNYYQEDFKIVNQNFLGEVVNKWEANVDAFKGLNIHVNKVRIGLVLSSKEGALPKLLQPIKFGLGAALGSGKQWQSWIHIQDLANLFLYVLQNNVNGIVNAVAPNPVTNEELTKAIAKKLQRPLFLPNIPKAFLKLVLGEMHILLFDSQRVSSKKIEDLGFNFKHYNIKAALEDLL